MNGSGRPQEGTQRAAPDDLPQYGQVNIATGAPIQACVQQGEIRLHGRLSLPRRMAAFNESIPRRVQASYLLGRAVTVPPVFLPRRRLHVDEATTANVDRRDQERLAKWLGHYTLIATLQPVHIHAPKPIREGTHLQRPMLAVLLENGTILHCVNSRIL